MLRAQTTRSHPAGPIILLIVAILAVSACASDDTTSTTAGTDTASESETSTTTENVPDPTTTSVPETTTTEALPSVAATVDGTEITHDQILSLVPPGGVTLTPDQLAQFLGYHIRWAIAGDAALEDWGIQPTDEEVVAETTRIYEAVSQGGESREDFLFNRGVTEEFLTGFARQSLIEQAVSDELESGLSEPSEEVIDQQLEIAERSATTVCVSHILVDTAEEAAGVLDRLETGEDFGELAGELSQDSGTSENGGELECVNAGQFVPEFRDAAVAAPIGEVHQEVVETQFGFHVILVRDRSAPESTPTREEVVADLQSDELTAALQEWFVRAATTADVQVDPAFGAWVTTPEPGVVPP